MDPIEAFKAFWPVIVFVGPLIYVGIRHSIALENRIKSVDEYGGEFTRQHVDTQLQLNQQILLSLQQLNEKHVSTDGRLKRVEDKVFPTS